MKSIGLQTRNDSFHGHLFRCHPLKKETKQMTYYIIYNNTFILKKQ